MKKTLALFIALAMLMASFAVASAELYPDGTLEIYSTGQPQYRKIFYDAWLDEHRDIIMNKVLPIKSLLRFLDNHEQKKR